MEGSDGDSSESSSLSSGSSSDHDQPLPVAASSSACGEQTGNVAFPKASSKSKRKGKQANKVSKNVNQPGHVDLVSDSDLDSNVHWLFTSNHILQYSSHKKNVYFFNFPVTVSVFNFHRRVAHGTKDESTVVPGPKDFAGLFQWPSYNASILLQDDQCKASCRSFLESTNIRVIDFFSGSGNGSVSFKQQYYAMAAEAGHVCIQNISGPQLFKRLNFIFSMDSCSYSLLN